MEKYYVHIMTNRSKTLNTGITNNLSRRVQEHISRQKSGFTKRYSINVLAYFEEFDDPDQAIKREKQITGWVRAKKIQLVETSNPEWKNLIVEIMPD